MEYKVGDQVYYHTTPRGGPDRQGPGEVVGFRDDNHWIQVQPDDGGHYLWLRPHEVRLRVQVVPDSD